MRRRLGTSAGVMTLAALPALLVAMLGDLWPWPPRDSRPFIERLEPDRWYALEVADDEAMFDLPFESGGEHLLIVSSLAADAHHGTIALSAEPVAAAEPIAGRAVESLAALLAAQPPPPHVAQPAASLSGTSLPGDRTSGGSGATSNVPDAVAAAATADSSPKSRTFHLHVTEGPLSDPRHYASIEGQPIAEGRTVRVYLDGRMRPHTLFPGLVGEIVRLMDDEIVPRTSRVLGTHRDVDGDGRFAILLTPWLERLQGGRTSLGGMVRGDDFRADREAPFGNRCDLMYLNASLKPDAHLRTLLAHEYAHAVCFSARLGSDAAPFPLPAEEDWINEAIAHVSEHLHEGGWSNLDYRVSRFLDDPAAAPLVVPDYYRAGLWRAHGCRGATFLFLRWCTDQFGSDLPARLSRAPYSGTKNLEHVTGVPFADLFRRWTIALHEAEAGSIGRAEAPSKDGFRSLDLHAPLANWGLTGPRATDWNVDAGDREIELRGAASAFVRLQGPTTDGVRRLRIRATPGTRLLVSLRSVPRPMPDVRLDARWIEHDSEGEFRKAAKAADRSPRRLSIDLTWEERTGDPPLEVEFVSCEINRGEKWRSHCLRGDELAQALRGSNPHLPDRGDAERRDSDRRRRGWRVEVPVRFAVAPDDTVTVKAMLRDARGRRTAARIEVFPPDPDRQNAIARSVTRGEIRAVLGNWSSPRRPIEGGPHRGLRKRSPL
ncbi:MAG: hypothetical protein WD066_12905 [Planctomycetaceae bacterium]